MESGLPVTSRDLGSKFGVRSRGLESRVWTWRQESGLGVKSLDLESGVWTWESARSQDQEDLIRLANQDLESGIGVRNWSRELGVEV